MVNWVQSLKRLFSFNHSFSLVRIKGRVRDSPILYTGSLVVFVVPKEILEFLGIVAPWLGDSQS